LAPFFSALILNHTMQSKTLRRAILTLAGLVMFASHLLAQTSASGGITGRVLDASNGSYLSNARVTVAGTSLQAFTDGSGQYRLDGVPAGSAQVRVFYTGLTESTLSVLVAAGQTATLDVSLGGDAKNGEVLKLDVFTVASKREMDAAAVAINEQRFAGGIKNVGQHGRVR
jgi:hypothetical protein